jgi:hypothetical protein
VTRTLVGGAAYLRGNILARVGVARFVEVAFLLRCGVDRIKGKRVKSEAQRFISSEEIKKNFRDMKTTSLQIINDINGRSLRRLLFVMNKGHLGLSYDNIREKDDVIIIRGAQIMYILRLY